MSTPRRFRLIRRVNDTKAEQSKQICKEIIISDSKTNEELESAPGQYVRQPIAILPVSTHHDEDSQMELANKLVKFLNNIRSVEEEAVKNDALLQNLK